MPPQNIQNRPIPTIKKPRRSLAPIIVSALVVGVLLAFGIYFLLQKGNNFRPADEDVIKQETEKIILSGKELAESFIAVPSSPTSHVRIPAQLGIVIDREYTGVYHAVIGSGTPKNSYGSHQQDPGGLYREVELTLLPDLDPNTIRSFGRLAYMNPLYLYADKNGVYLYNIETGEMATVPGIDGRTFGLVGYVQHMDSGPDFLRYFADEAHVYVLNPQGSRAALEILPDAESKSFLLYRFGWYAADVDSVFFYGRPIFGADRTSFTVISPKNTDDILNGCFYAKDKDRWYKGAEPIDAEPDLSSLGCSIVW